MIKGERLKVKGQRRMVGQLEPAAAYRACAGGAPPRPCPCDSAFLNEFDDFVGIGQTHVFIFHEKRY